jgi:acetamidase/formamidase
MKAQVDGAGLCLDDVHGYIGQGELGFAAIEVQASVTARVERSSGWFVDWPIIETADEIMVFGSYTSTYFQRPQLGYVDVVREAYRALREVVAHRIGGTIEDANSIVATAADIRNCALYGLGDYVQQEGKRGQADYDIALVACLAKDVFAPRRPRIRRSL